MNKYENFSSTEQFKNMVLDISKIPFSFIYDEIKYIGFDNINFKIIKQNCENTNEKLIYTFDIAFKDELNIILSLVHYKTHGFSEFTVWFENKTDKNTKTLKNICAEFEFKGDNPVLKGILGDHVNKYRPYTINLNNSSHEFISDSGRATHVNFPYFNLEFGNEGAVIVLGWAGTWKSVFQNVNNLTKVKLYSAKDICTYLKPNEKIRTGLFVVGNYLKRDENYATNYWRDWFIKYNLPKSNLNGDTLLPFSTCCFASDTGLLNSDGSISENYKTWKPTLLKMLTEKAKVDFRWVDAGWYIAPDKTSAQPFVGGKDWWDTVGTWEFDFNKWPEQTFLESVEYTRKENMKTLLWFEPERVTDVDNLVKNYGYKKEWAIIIKGQNTISNNIGNKECFDWTVDRICKTLKDNKIDLYREDNNCDPRVLWDYLDTQEGENRKGITECKFIDAHYKMWDKIIKCTSENGGCSFVDSCASGGGRNDLESLRRGIPLLRSDADRTSSSLRLSMSSSFNRWIPFCGANTKEKLSELAATGVSDKYVWRASYLPALNVDSQFVQDPNQNFDMLRFGLNEWKKVNKYLLKDFYCLTPYHNEFEKNGFTCFLYFDPVKDKGLILLFRQEECDEAKYNVELPFDLKNKLFEVTDEDTKETYFIENSFLVNFENKREAKLLWLTLKK